MTIYVYIFLFLVFIFCVNIFMKWFSLMKILLTFEIMVLNLIFINYFSSSEKIVVIFLLFVGVMEAILGLSLLIYSSRSFSSDSTQNFMW